jgi:hypothetical protein
MTSAAADAEAHFAQTYAEARQKFLARAGAAGLPVQSHLHPLPGHDGEALAIDVAREGPSDAPALLVVTSACHGVEGFCGSGVQAALLADRGWHAAVRASGVAVLYVHALNPHGFSWWRRVTHENVDLNRNFADFARPLPRNPAYDELADAFLPAHWPPPPEADARIQAYAARHGERALQTALSTGQYDHPQGMFFGGHGPTWSHLRLREVLREHGRRCARLGWVDVHTGLGPSGHGERIFAGRDDAAAIARARAWWGPRVTSIYDGSSASALLTGLISNAAYDECPQAAFTGIAMEYGTLPLPEVTAALRADHWLHVHPVEGAPQREAIRRGMRDAFYVDTPAWKAQVLAQGFEAAHQALHGLAA